MREGRGGEGRRGGEERRGEGRGGEGRGGEGRGGEGRRGEGEGRGGEGRGCVVYILYIEGTGHTQGCGTLRNTRHTHAHTNTLPLGNTSTLNPLFPLVPLLYLTLYSI